MPANCGEGSSQISSQIVYSSHEEFLSQNVRKYVEEVFDLSKVRVRVQDTSGTISFVMFDKETKHILRRSAYDIRNQQVKDIEGPHGENNSAKRFSLKDIFCFCLGCHFLYRRFRGSNIYMQE
ncbi:hypothetical protein R6Q59_001679 [Mikania micrantha]